MGYAAQAPPSLPEQSALPGMVPQTGAGEIKTACFFQRHEGVRCNGSQRLFDTGRTRHGLERLKTISSNGEGREIVGPRMLKKAV